MGTCMGEREKNEGGDKNFRNHVVEKSLTSRNRNQNQKKKKKGKKEHKPYRRTFMHFLYIIKERSFPPKFKKGKTKIVIICVQNIDHVLYMKFMQHFSLRSQKFFLSEFFQFVVQLNQFAPLHFVYEQGGTS